MNKNNSKIKFFKEREREITIRENDFDINKSDKLLKGNG